MKPQLDKPKYERLRFHKDAVANHLRDECNYAAGLFATNTSDTVAEAATRLKHAIELALCCKVSLEYHLQDNEN